jgi:hypothetical protein
VYAGALADGPVFAQLPTETQSLIEESVGAAQIVAGDLGTAAPAYLAEVSDAFMSGFGTASLVVALVAGAGAVFATKFLPPQATDVDVEARQLETVAIGDVAPAVAVTSLPSSRVEKAG